MEYMNEIVSLLVKAASLGCLALFSTVVLLAEKPVLLLDCQGGSQSR